MARYLVSPPCAAFSCEHGGVAAGEDGSFEIDNPQVVAAMQEHGFTLQEAPAEPAEPVKQMTAAEKKAAEKKAAAEAKAAEDAAAKAAAEAKAAEEAAANAAAKAANDAAALEEATRKALEGQSAG